MYSFTEENYLKAIYKLSENNRQSISTNAIADLLQTKAASVTDMIRKLAEKKLLKYEKYKGVELTEKGKRVAVDTVRKHRLWEVFLCDKLKFGWDEVHDIAEQLEHINSALLIDKLDAFLGYPSHDPHGDPIPTKNGDIKKSEFVLLNTVKALQPVIMSGVADHSVLFLQHLDKIGLRLGTSCLIEEMNAYDGSLKLKLNSKQSISISKDVAKNILVKPV
ncbi:MAG: metal-dependent transcriptional regulator [Bacteroidota bacterium]|jgi:DtxR family Mn-dependent transcriptional regulator|nr:metal-dependent transcriptional regulator [Sphingobacteriales bacterium]